MHRSLTMVALLSLIMLCASNATGQGRRTQPMPRGQKPAPGAKAPAAPRSPGARPGARPGGAPVSQPANSPATPSVTSRAQSIGRDRASSNLSFSGQQRDRRAPGLQDRRRPGTLPAMPQASYPNDYRRPDYGRPGRPDRPWRPNRPDVNVNVNQNNVNVNQTNINTGNVTNIVNNINNVTNVTNVNNQVVQNNVVNNFGPSVVNTRPWQNQYEPLHHHWHGGYWNLRYRPSMWLTPTIGMSVGAAPVVSYTYNNPYLGTSTTTYFGGYDYSHPIRPSAQEVSGRVTEEAIRRLDAARAAFRAQQYERCLDLVNSAIQLLPDDPVIHELRALTLFAMGDHESAAAVVYAVLGGGPGSDLNAVASLYSDPNLYLLQLGRLTEYIAANPDRTGPRLLLAYHLLILQKPDVAYAQLAEVLRRRPDDRVTAELMKALSQGSQ